MTALGGLAMIIICFQLILKTDSVFSDSSVGGSVAEATNDETSLT